MNEARLSDLPSRATLGAVSRVGGGGHPQRDGALSEGDDGGGGEALPEVGHVQQVRMEPKPRRELVSKHRDKVWGPLCSSGKTIICNCSASKVTRLACSTYR